MPLVVLETYLRDRAGLLENGKRQGIRGTTRTLCRYGLSIGFPEIGNL
jgi:hypothetical protein